MFNNTLNFLFHITNNNKSADALVGSFNTAISNSVLFLLLLFSLMLTFHHKGTTVHKVLGLLLVSIFTVFVWILQTQFLFIYIVYILAFISAVLMLFLSVVLMLPISTFTPKNNKMNTAFLLSTYSESNYLIILLIIALIILTLSLVSSKSALKFLQYSLEQSQAFTVMAALFQKKIWKLVHTVKICAHVCTGLLLKSKSFSISKSFLDIALQTYLFLGLILGIVAFSSKKQVMHYSNLDILPTETVQGIAQLKTLLYGEFSLLLIFSTLVLLVALLGAAVMTNKRSF